VFETILGLPAHVLVVHAAVVLTPLLVLVALGYAVVPPFRRVSGWAVVGLALVAPAVVYVARESGKAFRSRLQTRDRFPAQLAAKVTRHENYSTWLFYLIIALAVVSLLLVLVARTYRRRIEPPRSDGPGAASAPAPRKGGVLPVLQAILGLLVIGLAVASAYYIFKTGDSGARMTWEGQ